MRKREILVKGTILQLVSEDSDTIGRTDNKTERSWIIGDIVGEGGSAVCYQAVCGNKTGRLKVFDPFLLYEPQKLTLVQQCEEFLDSYRMLDRIRKENPESRKINNFISPFEILTKIEDGIRKGAYIWTPDDRTGITFEKFIIEQNLSKSEEYGQNLCRYITVLIALTECVKEFHSIGLYNLDLKPTNILVYFPWEEDPEHCQISLFDLDTITLYTDKATKRKVTDKYSAPELYMGNGDNRSDIYSIGIVLKDILDSDGMTQNKPYGIKETDILKEYLKTVYQKATEINQNNRYVCCEELLKDLLFIKRSCGYYLG